jgi:branched-chain amino acid transport system ATP-binding protein
MADSAQTDTGPKVAESVEGPDILTASHISKVFGGLVAVEDVTFSIPRRSIVSIIGPNGAGKTTFFNMLTGLYKPSTGVIGFDGQNMTGARPDKIVKAGMARTFQNIRLFGTMTAIENVLVGEHSRTKVGLFRSILRTPGQRKEERESREMAIDTLRYVGLKENTFEELSVNLSYGDQRRLEIARAHESERVGPPDLVHAEGARRARPHDPLDRARHEGRDGRLGADYRARPRHEDRRGQTGRGAGQ